MIIHIVDQAKPEDLELEEGQDLEGQEPEDLDLEGQESEEPEDLDPDESMHVETCSDLSGLLVWLTQCQRKLSCQQREATKYFAYFDKSEIWPYQCQRTEEYLQAIRATAQSTQSFLDLLPPELIKKAKPFAVINGCTQLEKEATSAMLNIAVLRQICRDIDTRRVAWHIKAREAVKAVARKHITLRMMIEGLASKLTEMQQEEAVW